MGHTRIYAVALILLIPAGAGVLAVHASPTCEKFVRTHVAVPVRNRVSKATLAAWAEWGKAHPNWKPNPNNQRPKYLMTQKESVDKVDFACEVPTTPVTTDLFFTPADLDVPPAINVPPMEVTQLEFPPLVPPEVAEIPPSPTIPNSPGVFIPPFIPPVFGGNPGVVPELPVNPPPTVEPVPEPASWMLVFLGMLGGSLVWVRREKSLAEAAVTGKAVAPRLLASTLMR